ncbi:MAG: hypothetical protein CMB80_10380 [Flammeovirgaceae bacterium]|nr:hypothetical protein [Flammeovirgaceae bacterium]MBE62624.1 hypothetical protein [Flammeovirgaceae bacterium]
MRPTISLLILLLLLFDSIQAQNLPIRPNQINSEGLKEGDWVYYYSQDWEEVNDPKHAAFYRLISYRSGKPIGKVGDYFANGKPQMIIDSLVTEDPMVFEGMLAEYNQDGNMVLVEYKYQQILDTSRTIKKFKDLITTYQKSIPNHPDLAYTANNLAYLYRENGQYDAAEIYYQMATDIRKTALGTEDVLYANSCNKLGYVLLKQRKFTEAEPYYEESYRVHAKTLGRDSDYTKNSESNLAYIALETGQFDKALERYKAINNYISDQSSKHYKYNCFQLAKTYAKMNNKSAALEFYMISKEVKDKSDVDAMWFEELLDK